MSVSQFLIFIKVFSQKADNFVICNQDKNIIM